jgi:high-affinity iron transporter
MWADALPNLVIGLREGLEIGLVVSILLAAVRRVGSGASTRPVWLGVLAATALSLGFGAVLTFSRAELSARAQSIFAGLLSLAAVVLVTAMIFWMRRTARGLSGELRAKVTDALAIGGGALAATAFFAVAREGLETALFIWTTVQASGDTVAPVSGAAAGLAVSIGLCWLLYRSSIRINIGVFFSRTAILLILIAAGVLSYGLGELQTAGLLPGHLWVAFDVSQLISTDTWWVSILTGITNLAPTMTWLQVGAYALYAAIVLAVFLRKPTANPTPASVPAPARRYRVNPWAIVAAAVVVPVIAVGAFALFAPSGSAPGQQVTVTAAACAADWKAGPAGAQTFTVVNKSGHGGEIYLVEAATGGVIGEIEGLGPGTRRSLTVNVNPGSYAWRCLVPGKSNQLSPVAQLSATTQTGNAPVAVLPVSERDLGPATDAYRAYVEPQLAQLANETSSLQQQISGGDLTAARTTWLQAQLTWERVGAAYGSFGDLADAIGMVPNGLPGGTGDPGFTGLHRIEFGLWHGQSAAQLGPYAAKLTSDVAKLRRQLPALTADPTDLPLRAHEILEDAQRFHLTGLSDLGAGAAYPKTLADVDATTAVLDRLAPLLRTRNANLLPTARNELAQLRTALMTAHTDGQWRTPSTVPLATRQQIDSRLGAALETLSAVPTILEVRQN